MRHFFGGLNKGQTRLQPAQYVPTVVKVLRNRHGGDVILRARDILGERAGRIGPVDLSRNVLLSWCGRYCRAYDRQPMVTGLEPDMAALCGDRSASTLIERYAQVGAAPMPTPMAEASRDAQRYQECAGYAGVRLAYSRRSRRMLFEVVTPDDLELEYSGDDPTEPTVVRHRGRRWMNGKWVEVVEVYDLTDLSKPSYRVHAYDSQAEHGVGGDVSNEAIGGEKVGDSYLAHWSMPDGSPYHPVVVRGHPDKMYDRLQQVEASLIVPVRWTAWGSGCDFSSHPARHVRGMVYKGAASSTLEGATAVADGPDVYHQWVDMDDKNPGEHWQDNPAFDPLTTAKAVSMYEEGVLSALDMRSQLEGTGGEPTARELEARETIIRAMLPECRRFDGELLARTAAFLNRLPAAIAPQTDFPIGPYGLLYRGEVGEALARAEDPSIEE